MPFIGCLLTCSPLMSAQCCFICFATINHSAFIACQYGRSDSESHFDGSLWSLSSLNSLGSPESFSNDRLIISCILLDAFTNSKFICLCQKIVKELRLFWIRWIQGKMDQSALLSGRTSPDFLLSPLCVSHDHYAIAFTQYSLFIAFLKQF